MGAFAQLLVEARELGIEQIDFNVNLAEIKETPDVPRWVCRGIDHLDKSGFFAGRSGEEALRALVEDRKAKK